MDVEDDAPPWDLAAGDDDVSEAGDRTAETTILARHISSKSTGRVKKPGKKISRYGIEYPSLPTSVVKRLAQRFAGKAKISSDTLSTIMQASDWFFEQLGDDLRAYANHAKGRTTINESDMLTLMRRQRQTSASATPYALAQRHLPRELLQELRMPAPAPVKKRRRKATAGEDEEVG
ncbi:putative Hhf4 [Cryphonectria parasitica EP155]|uniref:Hhf4 n=1 Tax=Cryphonectria parasitica (strain ATCC 38755 / EP155) TaxID=660469 RepID=A0A9P4Y159_CRYP1|nr:putative Hhf4 [Cryphonectria parasitica EP155]KAF3765084.1 putative Hhf4 [Cryphonectria parasitica EP155]